MQCRGHRLPLETGLFPISPAEMPFHLRTHKHRVQRSGMETEARRQGLYQPFLKIVVFGQVKTAVLRIQHQGQAAGALIPGFSHHGSDSQHIRPCCQPRQPDAGPLFFRRGDHLSGHGFQIQAYLPPGQCTGYQGA